MSRMKQKYVLYSLSDVVVPVLVTEMKFGPRKLKILNLEKWYFRVRHCYACIIYSFNQCLVR